MTRFEHTPFDVFLDLDGVFADFDGKIRELTGFWPREIPKKELWKTVYRQDDFFASLSMMHGADVLWEYFRPFKPTFLTGAPNSLKAQAQKVEWVKEKFGPEWVTIVLPKRDKQLHSGPRKLLVDDNAGNIEQWVAKGGYGFLYTGDAHGTITQIEELRLALLS